MNHNGVLWQTRSDLPGINLANPRAYFCKTPPITLCTAFKLAADTLPAGAHIAFTCAAHNRHITTWITPFRDEPKAALIHTYNPDYKTIRLDSIRVGEYRRAGLGSFLLRSQLPLWTRLEARHIDLATHSFAVGFYNKLGFSQIEKPPSHADIINQHAIFMRMDLSSPEQTEIFTKALTKKRGALPVPLSNP